MTILLLIALAAGVLNVIRGLRAPSGSRQQGIAIVGIVLLVIATIYLAFAVMFSGGAALPAAVGMVTR